MDNVDYMICETQRDIYKYAAEHGYNMEWFSAFFLNSDFCARAFDVTYSRFQLETPVECMDFILKEAGTQIEKTYKKANKWEVDVAGFVGLMYRMLYIITPYTSKELCEKIPYNEVKSYYGVSAQETENYIAEDICIKFHLKYNTHQVDIQF